MSYDAFNAPLGIFNMLTDAHMANVEIVKQASANDSLDSLSPTPHHHSKEASAQPTRDESILAGLEKSAAIYGVAAEQFLRQAESAGQLASPHGPEDNENKQHPRGHFDPPEASTNHTSNKGMETGGAGPNHIKTDEDNSANLSYTASSDALGKKAEIEVLRLYLKKVAEKGQHTTIGSSGTAAGQPGSPVGPADNENSAPSNNTAGSHMVTGSPSSVAATTAQEAERHAKGHEFPIAEPQGHKSNVESGPGAGPTDSASSGPDPHKTAALGNAAAAKDYLLGLLHQKEAESKCAKCAELEMNCKCEPSHKKEDKDDKGGDEGQDKESMMGGDMDPSAMAADPSTSQMM